MINVKNQVYQAIKGITDNVSDSHPKERSTLPAVQYTEEDNSVEEWCDGKESKSHLLYRVDIWSEESTSTIALSVDEAIAPLGLQRIECGDVADPSGLSHKIMRYEGIIDVDSQIVYN